MSHQNGRINRLLWAGPLVMLFLFGHLAFRHGETWECGRYWMPRTLLAPDGVHMRDGLPVAPFDGLLIRAGIEEEFQLTMVILTGVLSVGTVRVVWSARQMKKQLTESLAGDARPARLRHAGPGESDESIAPLSLARATARRTETGSCELVPAWSASGSEQGDRSPERPGVAVGPRRSGDPAVSGKDRPVVPVVRVLCVGHFVAGVLGLRWYESLSSERKEEADRLAAEVAPKLCSTTAENLTPNQLRIVGEHVRQALGC